VRLVPLAATLILSGCGRQQPQAVRQAVVNPHSVTIAWKPVRAPVAGYNVYRALPPGGPIKVSSSIVTDTQFADRTAEAGNTYSYFVTAVDSKGIESRPSEKVSVTVPTGVAPPPKQ